MRAIGFFAEKVIRQRKRVSPRDHSVHILVIRNLLNFWIRLSIASDVWQSIWFVRVWPPVRREAHVVVLIPAGRTHGFVQDRQTL